MLGRSLLSVRKLMPLFALVAGCVTGTSDSYFRVKGNVADQLSGNAPCVLRLHAEEAARIVDYRDVTGSFETSFVVPAGRASYYFTVECPSAATYRSGNYQLGRSEDFNRTIDLGDVTPSRSQLPH